MPIGQSETKTKPQSTKASNSMEEGSGSRTFELDHMKQQLKVSQDELHIAQQQLQLANSRIEVQQKLYESQRDLYEVQLASYRRPQVRGQGDVGKAIERAWDWAILSGWAVGRLSRDRVSCNLRLMWLLWRCDASHDLILSFSTVLIFFISLVVTSHKCSLSYTTRCHSNSFFI